MNSILVAIIFFSIIFGLAFIVHFGTIISQKIDWYKNGKPGESYEKYMNRTRARYF